ncbi:TlpA family protein disulfide reductase [Chitinophagaceae bacterium LB-8]|uniref:TlpA family protein disulfide reductase n=1 Tax=Paraflavisolibacter caeni TaxID=2982496 RepID=A0A9X2XZ91_9BACT|nr:TlpA disulfide reductase family protein [Paraflavisolibacter caeni]MCU7551955.1 TlpA family protein disulfide reductase [Paraflavisolibacter caeni]
MDLRWLLLIGMFSCHASVKQEKPATTAQKVYPEQVTIEVNLAPLNRVLFNYTDNQNQQQGLEFKNPSKHDTIVTKNIALNRPTHFTRGVITGGHNNKFTVHIDNYLVLPGDTLKLQSADEKLFQRYYSGGTVQLDNIFLIPTGFEAATKKTRKEDVLKSIDDSSAKSLAFIETSYQQKKIKKEYYDVLKQFAQLNRYNNISKYASAYLSAGDYSQLLGQLEGMNSVGSKQLNNILDLVIQHQKSSIGNGNRWSAFSSLPDSLKTKQMIKQYALHQLKSDGSIKSKTMLEAQLNLLAKAGFADPMFTNYYEEYVHLENLKSVTSAGMVNTKGDTVDFRSLLQSLKGKYVFVDIWASWCMPCRQQIPFLQKTKESLKHQNIAFVSLSIDIETLHNEWLKASHSEELDKEAYNFRLIGGYRNKFIQVNKISTAPRYLLYGPQGEIVNNDFITPDKNNFKTELLSYLKE